MRGPPIRMIPTLGRFSGHSIPEKMAHMKARESMRALNLGQATGVTVPCPVCVTWTSVLRVRERRVERG